MQHLWKESKQCNGHVEHFIMSGKDFQHLYMAMHTCTLVGTHTCTQMHKLSTKSHNTHGMNDQSICLWWHKLREEKGTAFALHGSNNWLLWTRYTLRPVSLLYQSMTPKHSSLGHSDSRGARVRAANLLACPIAGHHKEPVNCFQSCRDSPA